MPFTSIYLMRQDLHWHMRGSPGFTTCRLVQNELTCVRHFRIGSIQDESTPKNEELCPQCFNVKSEARVTIAPWVIALIEAAGAVPSKRPAFYLAGDLAQMALQKAFLQSQKIEIEQADVHPVIMEDADVRRALQLLWETRFPGWWHYRSKLEELGICDKATLIEALAPQK